MDDQRPNDNLEHNQAIDLRPSVPPQQNPIPDTLPAPVAPAQPQQPQSQQFHRPTASYNQRPVAAYTTPPTPPAAPAPPAIPVAPAAAPAPVFAATAQPQQSAPAPAPAVAPLTNFGDPDPNDLDERHFMADAQEVYGNEPQSSDEQYQAQEAPIAPPDLTWQAQEFIAHPKTKKWYLNFVLVSVAVLVIAFLLTRDVMTAIAVIICAVLFGYMAARNPRELSYGLSDKGVYVGNKFYPYSGFNAFAVVEESGQTGIDFLPLKRFAPTLSVYFDPKIEDSLLDLLAQHLPLSHHKRNYVDGLMNRIHF